MGQLRWPLVVRTSNSGIWLSASWVVIHLRSGSQCLPSMLQEAMHAAIEQSARAADVGAPLQVTTAEIYNQDWEASVRESYKPLQLTEELWIVPDWCAARASLFPGLCRPHHHAAEPGCIAALNMIWLTLPRCTRRCARCCDLVCL
jgi:ribosomal protein L11 methylase PrmA